MGNSLNIDLKNKWVVLKQEFFKKGLKAEENLFFCENGFGCNSYTSGTAVFGKFQDNEEARISGYDIDRLATKEEIKGVSKK